MSDRSDTNGEQGRADYEPPAAEDIDTTHEPAETVAGFGSPRTLGVEESDRWH